MECRSRESPNAPISDELFSASYKKVSPFSSFDIYMCVASVDVDSLGKRVPFSSTYRLTCGLRVTKELLDISGR